jgi:hypothetical protein
MNKIIHWSSLGRNFAINILAHENTVSNFIVVNHQTNRGSYGYYDCSTSGRGFIPVAGDIAFPSISDKVDIINNNNGKRRGDHSQDKHYKRNRHECFSLQQQIDDKETDHKSFDLICGKKIMLKIT